MIATPFWIVLLILPLLASAADPCSIYTTCSACSNNPECGWCTSTQTCLTGTATSASSSCENNWKFHTCDSDCAAGYYKASAGKCLICQPATYAHSGSSTCTPCPANTYSRFGSTSESDCAREKYVLNDNFDTPAPSNWWSPTSGVRGSAGCGFVSTPVAMIFSGASERTMTLKICLSPAWYSLKFSLKKGSGSCNQPETGENFIAQYSDDMNVHWLRTWTASDTGTSFVQYTKTFPATVSQPCSYITLKQTSFSGLDDDVYLIENLMLQVGSSCYLGSYGGGMGQGGCTKCPLGTYSSTLGATSVSSCVQCPIGKYASSTGQSTCNSCSYGSYADSLGNSACTPCPKGTYGQTSSGTSVSVCIPCNPGTYMSTTGRTLCDKCPGGTYGPSSGLTECSECAGMTFTEPGAQNASQCTQVADVISDSVSISGPRNWWSSTNGVDAASTCGYSSASYSYVFKGDIITTRQLTASVCNAHPLMWGLRFAMRRGNDDDDCENPDSGEYLFLNVTSPSISFSQAYDPATSPVSFTIFDYKFAEPNPSLQHCTYVSLNQPDFSTGGAYDMWAIDDVRLTAYGVCAEGWKHQGSICVPCEHGSWSPLGSSVCITCLPGQYSGSSSSSCVSCPAGTYSASSGATICEPCPIGMFSTGNSSECSECAPGRYSNRTGSVQCDFCAPDSYQSGYGASYCSKCPAGQWANALNATACHDSPIVLQEFFTSQTLSQLYTTSNVLVNSQCGHDSSPYALTFTGLSPRSFQFTLCSRPSFWILSYAIKRGSGTTCENVDSGEDLQLFIDGQMKVTYPYTSSTYYVDFSETILPQNPCTTFMFKQLSSSGPSYDHWGLDNLVVKAYSNCMPGQYETGGGCIPCPFGTHSNGSSTLGCHPCSAGTYSTAIGASTSETCVPCSAGYWSSSSSSACIGCEIGKYSTVAGTSVSQCLDCGYGTFNSKTGQSVCSQCSYGTYLSTTGGTNSSDCYSCGAGKYSSQLGASNATVCQSCPPGYWSQGQAVQSCVRCAAGTWNTAVGATSSSACIGCQIGKYSTKEGATNVTTCVACPAGGASAQAGATSCSSCLAGTWSSDTGLTSLGDCKNCSIGTWSSGIGQSSETTCTQCSIGRYSSILGSSTVKSCIGCGSGRFSDVSGVSDAICQSCKIGSYSAAEAATSNATCTLCAQGWFSSVVGAGMCTGCPPGTYGNMTGSISIGDCHSCPPGSTSGVNATTCTLCGYGTWSSDSAASACQNCPPGTSHNETGATSISSCVVCPAGTTSITGTSECRPCPAGTWASTSGATSCSACVAGTFSSVAGAMDMSVCTSCAPGSWSSNSSSVCTDCPLGTWRSDVGGTSISSCRECSAGTYGNDTGITSPNGCLSCTVGYYSLDGASMCTLCPGGQYQSTSGMSSCTLCPVGKWSSALGGSTLDSCNDCAPGRYSSSLGTTLCSPCQTGTYAAVFGSTQCNQCWLGAYASTTGMSACQDCLPGRWSSVGGASSCNNCPRGTYGPYSGQSSVSKCVGCNPGSYSTALGASLVATCSQCLAGRYNAMLGQSTCKGCPAGTYSSAGASVCQICPSGSVSLPLSSSCQSCSAGQFAKSSTVCTLCRVNTYCPPLSAAEVPCPANTLSGNGSKVVTDCSCKVDYYHPTGARGKPCFACPPGAICPGSTSIPYAQEGFFQVPSSSGSVQFIPCGNRDACIGSNQCAAHYTGMLCSTCTTGYFKLVQSCVECPASSEAATLWFIVYLLLFFVLARLAVSFISTSSFVIIWSNLQIAALFAECRFRWGWSVALLNGLSLTNFNVELFASACYDQSFTFFQKFALTMAMPFIIASLYAIWHGIIVWRGPAVAPQRIPPASAWDRAKQAIKGWMYHQSVPSVSKQTTINAFCLVLLLMYIPLSTKILQVFDCTGTIMDADPAIVCGSADHNTIVGWAVVFTLLYIIGIPIGAFVLLYRNRSRIRGQDPSIPETYGSILARYRPRYYWHEIMLLLQRLALVTIVVSLTSQPMWQGILGIIVLIITLGLQFGMKPYTAPSLNHVAVVMILSNTLAMLAGTGLLVDTISQSPDVASVTRAIALISIVIAILMLFFTVFQGKRSCATFLTRADVHDDSFLYKYWSERLSPHAIPYLVEWLDEADDDEMERLTEAIQEISDGDSATQALPTARAVLDLGGDSRARMQQLIWATLSASSKGGDVQKTLSGFLSRVNGESIEMQEL